MDKNSVFVLRFQLVGILAEILETVLPDRAVMAACRRLKSQGYVFALDDYCHSAGMRREVDELFLLGLLSVMDALLNMRMSDVLAEIPVGQEIKEALPGFPSRYRPIFEVMLDYESGTWSNWRIRRAPSG